MNILDDMADAVIGLSDRTIDAARFYGALITLVMGSTWRVRWVLLRIAWLTLRRQQRASV